MIATWLIVIAAATTSQRSEAALAPDGSRGFGREAEARDVHKLFRSPKGEDRAFVAHLLSLEREAEVLLHLAAANYRGRGYFDLATDPLADLFALQAEWERVARDVFKEPLAERRARAFARMLVDARFRVRKSVLRSYGDARRELSGALALLVESAKGIADLTLDSTLPEVLERADLAAAQLRALTKDLEALHEVPRWSEPPAEDADFDDLVSALTSADSAGAAPLARLEARTRRTERGMSAALFTTKLEELLAPALQRRKSLNGSAAERLAEMRVLLPFTDEGAKAEGPVASWSKSDRTLRAIGVGLAGLKLDPLNEELNYLVAVARDLREGRRFSVAYFDRFLALRGIRYYDDKTITGRDLDAREERALLELLHPRPGPPGAGE